jgi:hypothetical protein
MMLEPDSSTGALRRWLESLTITMLSPLLGLAISRSDPFLIRADFPWLVLVPLLVGAQHGMLPALASAALLGARAYWQAATGGGLTTDVVSWLVGCLLVGAIAGHFRDRMQRHKELLLDRVLELGEQLQRAPRVRHVVEAWPPRHETRPQPSIAPPAPTGRSVTASGFSRRAVRRARS